MLSVLQNLKERLVFIMLIDKPLKLNSLPYINEKNIIRLAF